MERVYAVQDQYRHWYVIPYEQREEFQSDLDGLSDENIYEWEDKYAHYMTGGDLNLVELYAKI